MNGASHKALCARQAPSLRLRSQPNIISCQYTAAQLHPGLHRYIAQRSKHSEVLARFPVDMEALAAIEIHPAARSKELRRLIDLVPEPGMRQWAADCAKAHQHLGEKVGDDAFRHLESAQRVAICTRGNFTYVEETWDVHELLMSMVWCHLEDLNVLSKQGNIHGVYTIKLQVAGMWAAVNHYHE